MIDGYTSIFLFDDNYARELTDRLAKLARNRLILLGTLDPKHIIMCKKLLDFICRDLAKHHPLMFRLFKVNGVEYIQNRVSGHHYKIASDDPLLVIASLIIEDVNILMPSEGEFYLVSTLTINPVGWSPTDRLNFTMSKIHGEIKDWPRSHGLYLNRFFNKTLDNNNIYRRTAKFYQIKPDLMRLSKNPPCNFIMLDFLNVIFKYLVHENNRSISGLSCVIKRYLIHGTITLKDLHFRVEVQHFFCIPGEKFVCFTVRTFIFSYSSLSLLEQEAFLASLPSKGTLHKPGYIRDYHRVDDWAYLLELEKKNK